ncbi:MAG: hypothetical protein IKA20_00240 [Clostridia bacterium]|nr:hypothetical protein [Clostridia bacterium]
MKRFLTLFLTFIFALSLVACNGGDTENSSSQESSPIGNGGEIELPDDPF